MSHILIYTSAPKGLAANKSGYCTVAKDAALPGNLERELESHSGYRWLGDPGDPLNPVAFLHYKVKVAGNQTHLISRIADSGKDHTGRSNKLACHLAFDPGELPLGGPGWLLHQGVLPKAWDGKLNGNLSVNIPTSGEDRPGCGGWKNKTGDAGWGGVLAQAIADRQRQPIYVIYQKGFDLLALFRESLSLLPNRLRWDATFTTFFTKLPPGLECHWRGVVAGTEQETLARRSGNVIDLTTTLGAVDGKHQGEYIDAARTGRKLQLKKQAAAPRQSVEVPDDYALEASLRKEERKTSPAPPPDRRSSPKGAPPPMPAPTPTAPTGRDRPRRQRDVRLPATPLPESSASGRESKGILPIIIALMILFLIVVGGVTWNLAPWASDTASITSRNASRPQKPETSKDPENSKTPDEPEKKAAAKAKAKKKAEEELAKKKAEEELAKKKAEEELAKKKAEEEQAARKPFGEAVLLALQQSMLGKSETGEEEFLIIDLNTNSETIKTFQVQLDKISDGSIPDKWTNEIGPNGSKFNKAVLECLDITFYPEIKKKFEIEADKHLWRFQTNKFKIRFSAETSEQVGNSSGNQDASEEKDVPLAGTFHFETNLKKDEANFLSSRMLCIKDKETQKALYIRLQNPNGPEPQTRIPGALFGAVIRSGADQNREIKFSKFFNSSVVPKTYEKLFAELKTTDSSFVGLPQPFALTEDWQKNKVEIPFKETPARLEYRVSNDSGHGQMTEQQARSYEIKLKVDISLKRPTDNKIKLELSPSSHEYKLICGDTPRPMPQADPINLHRNVVTDGEGKKHFEALKKGFEKNRKHTTLASLLYNKEKTHTQISNSDEFYKHLLILGDPNSKWKQIEWPDHQKKFYDPQQQAEFPPIDQRYKEWRARHVWGLQTADIKDEKNRPTGEKEQKYDPAIRNFAKDIWEHQLVAESALKQIKKWLEETKGPKNLHSLFLSLYYEVDLPNNITTDQNNTKIYLPGFGNF